MKLSSVINGTIRGTIRRIRPTICPRTPMRTQLSKGYFYFSLVTILTACIHCISYADQVHRPPPIEQQEADAHKLFTDPNSKDIYWVARNLCAETHGEAAIFLAHELQLIPSEVKRAEVAGLLRFCGIKNVSIIPDLLKVANDPSPRVRSAVAAALIVRGEYQTSTAVELTLLLNPTDERLTEGAFNELMNLPRKKAAAETLPQVEAALSEFHGDCYTEALLSQIAIGLNPDSFVKHSPENIESCAESLLKIGDAHSVAQSVDLLAGMHYLSGRMPKGHPAHQELNNRVRAIRNRHPEIRSKAAEVLPEKLD